MFYKDVECKENLAADSEGNESIYFETVPIGEEREITIYWRNEDGVAEFYIEKLEISDSDVAIAPFQKIVKPKRTIPIILKWSPTLKIRGPLKASLTMDGYYIF